MEKVAVKIFPHGSSALAQEVVAQIVELIKENNTQGRNTVLGLATGSTPVEVYRELIKQHQQSPIDFSRVHTFNLDEYFELPPEHPNSYNRYMNERLFQHLPIPKGQVHVPDGLVPESEVETYCAKYEAAIHAAGGIDIQLLGIGRDGHIGFNEPGSSRDSRTRLVVLNAITLSDALKDFGDLAHIPKRALTMGVATIMDAKQVFLLATGEHKAEVIKQAIEGEITSQVVASFLQTHPRTLFYLDEPAASTLTRVVSPWLANVGNWHDPKLRAKAMCWLAEKSHKAMSQLTPEDFVKQGVSGMLQEGDVATFTSAVLDVLKSRIVDASKLPEGKRIVVFTPHIDDCLRSIGGTLFRLQQRGNNVRCIWLHKGGRRVPNSEVLKFVHSKLHFDLLSKNSGLIEADKALVAQVTSFLQTTAGRRFGLSDPEGIKLLKGAIRLGEGVTEYAALGINDCELIPSTTVESVWERLQTYKPDIIVTCYHFTSPAGAHSLSWKLVSSALQRYATSERPEVWLYRPEAPLFPPAEADILMPLDDPAIETKRTAMRLHPTASDPQLPTGALWHRAEESCVLASQLLALYGIAGYSAFETLKRYVYPA